MTQIAEGVHFIPGQDEFIPDSHIYVVGDLTSRDLSLVDVGLIGKAGYKIQSLQRMGINLKDIKRIIMTHTHLDHIGCLSEILKKIPWAELWVHTLEAAPLEKGDERTVYGMDMFRTLCQTQYGLKSGAFAFQTNRTLEGGETLNIGGTKWEVIHIPGHSMGSIALYHRTKKILIPGDVVYADYAIGRFDLHGANASDLKTSLMRLAKLDVDILLPGHNQTVKNLPKGYIQETAIQWESYLV
ncbi:MAG TPA: MBL fold metallo-hydrolase [Thermodesulfobacteriota bacterium]|nr:MBL fold metallo-hydrolase [Thermodesulfobacteriota bacterium]